MTIALAAVAATAKPNRRWRPHGMLVGIYDPVQPLIAPETTFPTLVKLHVKIIRIGLDWGTYIATTKPEHPIDPADPAYNWAQYDNVVLNAHEHKIQVLFTIYGTPRWANGGQEAEPRAEEDALPAPVRVRRGEAVQRLVRAAGRDGAAGRAQVDGLERAEQPGLPAAAVDRRSGRSTSRSPRSNYAQMCSAVWAGVHATNLKETVACGATDPRGNNRPRSSRARRSRR